MIVRYRTPWGGFFVTKTGLTPEGAALGGFRRPVTIYSFSEYNLIQLFAFILNWIWLN